MKREAISFRKKINAGETEILSERIKDGGTVEEIRVRFYKGSEGALKVRPYLVHDSRKLNDIFTYPEGTQKYLSGDDDYFVYPVSADVNIDDEMKVWVFNDNTSYPYTVSVDVIVSYSYYEGD